MSRIGRKPIKLADKVKIVAKPHSVLVEGPLGKLEALLPTGVTIRIEAGVAHVVAPKPSRSNRGYQGLMRALLANMVQGVAKGYERNLEITGVGYKAEQKGKLVRVSAGYSHVWDLEVPPGITVKLDKTQTKVNISGIDKQLVGQFAAQFRSIKPPEPYKGKGIKYAEETIRRKAGKTGAK